MKYRQLNAEERSVLGALRTLGLSRAEIARQLGRHRSTVCRELQRNSALRWRLSLEAGASTSARPPLPLAAHGPPGRRSPNARQRAR